MPEHILSDGDTLGQVAERYLLSGWQGLYYAQANRRLREEFPDPWSLGAGCSVAIPDFADQEATLLGRMRSLEDLERRVRRLASEQQGLLGSALLQRALDDPHHHLGDFVRALGNQTLAAIALLKGAETAYSATDGVLAGAALMRWGLVTPRECATLFSLLSRAARAVPWVIPAAAARGWCDVASPQYWGKALLSIRSGSGGQSNETLLALGVRRSLEVAVADVIRQVAMLRSGATMELNNLHRNQHGVEG